MTTALRPYDLVLSGNGTTHIAVHHEPDLIVRMRCGAGFYAPSLTVVGEAPGRTCDTCWRETA